MLWHHTSSLSVNRRFLNAAIPNYHILFILLCCCIYTCTLFYKNIFFLALEDARWKTMCSLVKTIGQIRVILWKKACIVYLRISWSIIYISGWFLNKLINQCKLFSSWIFLCEKIVSTMWGIALISWNTFFFSLKKIIILFTHSSIQLYSRSYFIVCDN